MSLPMTYKPDAKRDLIIERTVDVPRELVWAAWTRPDHLKKWYTPAPWATTEAEVDLRPGGLFRTVARGPEGQEYESVSCYLEVIENERLIWTDALGPGFRPTGRPILAEVGHLTAIISFQAHGKGTRYTAIAIHKDEASSRKHEEMGFHEGWGQVADQLMELARTLRAGR